MTGDGRRVHFSPEGDLVEKFWVEEGRGWVYIFLADKMSRRVEGTVFVPSFADWAGRGLSVVVDTRGAVVAPMADKGA